MARIVYTLGELKGSVGGLTFQNNSSGKIVRQRPNVKKTSSIKQQAAHQNHISLLQTYSLLTNEQKDLWNTYANTYTKINKFGESKELTGQNWYESVNYQRLIRSLGLFSVPPIHTLPPSVPPFEIVLSSDKIIIAAVRDFATDVSEINIWTTIPTTRVKPSVNQIRKFVGIITYPSSDTLDITTEWENATGLTWNPLTQFPRANIFVCLESVSTGSYITSALLCTKENTNEITTDTGSTIYYEAY